MEEKLLLFIKEVIGRLLKVKSYKAGDNVP